MKKIIYLSFIITYSVIAQKVLPKSDFKPTENTNKINSGCQFSTSRAILEVNNVRTTLLNGGDMWWDLDNARYEIPKVTNEKGISKNSIFAGSLWIAGRDQPDGNGNLMLTSQTYRQAIYSLWQGPLGQNTLSINANECSHWDRHFSVWEDSVLVFRKKYQDGQIINTNNIPKSVLTWPSKGNPHMGNIWQMSGVNMNFNLAPFNDVNNDGIYNPMHGDYPITKGGQSIWWVMNDVGGNKIPASNPMGVEVQVEAYGCNDCFTSNSTFYNYKIINKSSNKVYDTYVTQWVDFDLGSYDDDFIQCDVSRGMGIGFNGDDYDEAWYGYGYNPPAIGFDFIKGPKADANDGIDNNRNGVIDEANEEIILSNFFYNANNASPVNGEPNSAQHYYNYMRSIFKDGTPLKYDGQMGMNSGLPCKFIFPGNSDPYGWGVGGTPSNPNPQAEWSEFTTGNIPADRRFLQSAGPFTFESGEVTEFEIGVIWSRNPNEGNMGSFNKLLTDNDLIQTIYDKQYNALKGPKAPIVSPSFANQKIILNLTPASFYAEFNNQSSIVTTETYQENYNGEIYSFQGYQVFQVFNKHFDITFLNYPELAKQIAQCDKQDNIGSITNADNLGSVTASNSGIIRRFQISHDAFTGELLKNNTNYYFVVVPYMVSNNPSSPIRYWRGCRNAEVIVAKKYSDANNPFDELYNARGIEIKRINGTGNSGNYLKLKKSSEDEILANNYANEIMYEKRNSPITVSIDDINIASNKQFRLELSSRLIYENNGIALNVGDTIQAIDFPKIDSTTVNNDPDKHRNMASGIVQIPGKSVIQRIVNNNSNFITLDVNLTNNHLGGTFKMQYDTLSEVFLNSSTSSFKFIEHLEMPISFKKIGATDTFKTILFQPMDYWKLTDLTVNDITYCTLPISEELEEVVSSKGISILINNKVYNPSYKFKSNNLHSESTDFTTYLGGEIKYADNSLAWIKEKLNPTIDYRGEFINFWLDKNQHIYFDPTLSLFEILGYTWAPYLYAKNSNSNGPAYYISSNLNVASPNVDGQLNRLKNVDIVYTSDQSKWTKVAVLQYDQQIANLHPAYKLNKSLMPSVDKAFNTTGEISPYKLNGADSLSRGMSWFPGYAIDLDRGVRLNMMFSESKLKDPTNGNNLQWNPGEADTLKSFIYVLNSVYDSCKTVQYIFDSIRFANLSISQLQVRLNNAFSTFQIMYVGNIQLKAGQTALQTDARTSIRVSRAFESYNFANSEGAQPEYMFTIPASMSVKNENNLILNALSLYPNPNNEGIFTINLEKNTSIEELKVYDIMGKMLSSNYKKGTYKLNLTHLPSGLYLVKMLTNNGEEITKKVVIEK
jgi:hypothetical protein